VVNAIIVISGFDENERPSEYHVAAVFDKPGEDLPEPQEV